MGCGASSQGKYTSEDDESGPRKPDFSERHTEPPVRKVFAIPKEELDGVKQAHSSPEFSARHSFNARLSNRSRFDKATVPEMLQSEHSGGLPAGEASPHDCKWHTQHCNDRDFHPAASLMQAYPYNDADRKIYEKKEKCWSPDDALKPQHWGSISVGKIGPKKLCCGKCGKVVADRNPDRYLGDHPFMFCLRCRNEGKHFALCIPCYNGGALATGKRPKVDAAEIAQAKRDEKLGGEAILRHKNAGEIMGRKVSTVSHNSSEESSLRGSPSVRSNNGPRFGSKLKPHPSIPSGRWKGKYFEGASGRQAERLLNFGQDGGISGEGGSCNLSGSVDGIKVTWTEFYDWGTIKVDGDLDYSAARPKIKGKFVASDGGGGKIELMIGGK